MREGVQMGVRMRIAICEDEEKMRELLAEKVRRHCPDAELLLLQSGEELLRLNPPPQLLLLDIGLPDMDGMAAARAFRGRNKDAVLVFVTALEEYVFQAFDVGAFHYLLKPFSDEKFNFVFCRALSQAAKQAAAPPAGEAPHIWVKRNGIRTKVLLADILYAEVYNRKIILHKKDGDMEYYGRMAELEKQAGDTFFRSHRAYLVNLQHVVRYDAATVSLERGTALMAKPKFPEFVKRYMRYNRREGQVPGL